MSEFSHMEVGHEAGSQFGGEHGIGVEHRGVESMGGPSNTAVWNPGVKGVKLTDMLQGINVTPNFMLAMLFLGFTSWLFVVYWIRHNEPLANQVLGSPTAGAPTSHDDRRIVAGAKNALPIRTPRSGSFYTPDKKLRDQSDNHSHLSHTIPHTIPLTTQNQNSAQPQNNFNLGGSPAYGMHAPTAPPPPTGASNHSRLIKGGREHTVVHHPEPMVIHPSTHYSSHAHPHLQNQNHSIISGHHAAIKGNFHPANSFGQTPLSLMSPPPATLDPGQSQLNSTGAHFFLPVQSREGTKLKTVVSR